MQQTIEFTIQHLSECMGYVQGYVYFLYKYVRFMTLVFALGNCTGFHLLCGGMKPKVWSE